VEVRIEFADANSILLSRRHTRKQSGKCLKR